jgi:hypothetical protein
VLLAVVPYRAAMGTLVVVVFTSVVAGLNVAIGVAMTVRSRRQPSAILWRGKRLVAPRLAACSYLFLGLFFADLAISHVLFEPGSKGNGFMVLVATVFAVATTVTSVMWSRRRGSAARHPTPS